MGFENYVVCVEAPTKGGLLLQRVNAGATMPHIWFSELLKCHDL